MHLVKYPLILTAIPSMVGFWQAVFVSVGNHFIQIHPLDYISGFMKLRNPPFILSNLYSTGSTIMKIFFIYLHFE